MATLTIPTIITKIGKEFKEKGKITQRAVILAFKKNNGSTSDGKKK